MTTTTATTSVADRLSSTLFVAALAHGVAILGVTFADNPFGRAEDAPALSVTLLVDTNSAVEADTDLLASVNAVGGGRADDVDRPTTMLAAEQPFAQPGETFGADFEHARPRDAAPEADRVASRSSAERQIQAVPEATESPAPVPMRAAAMLSEQVPKTLAAEIDDTIRSRGNDADDPLESPSARESVVAAYLVGWRQRIERIGTANFPRDFLERGSKATRPVLEVAIGPDGQLEDIIVQQSSGDTALDQAALKILRMAAPFEPLPPSILADYEQLRFAYEWDFSAG